MTKETENDHKPAILAPAGTKASFLAAIAAGADAVYCGLKHFSARMAADNFSLEELSQLAELARRREMKVYVAFNTLVKPGDLPSAARLLEKLSVQVAPEGIIVSDLAFVALARQVGYRGEVHLSTLSNMSFPGGLSVAEKLPGVKRVVVPRELDIDEIKAVADGCPAGIDLEVFIHGALCYAVSGRCYWSSWFGGKSGLRGRCVQPCRRVYDQKGQKKRFFSCQDLSLDVLVKVLKDVRKVSVWKIEGRKKGPHYVYYTVLAYRMLRDQGKDPKMKKTALAFLEQALGRRGTHYNFLPQRPQNPVDISVQTGSGLLVGKVQGNRQSPYLVVRQPLLTGDLLRVGYEDEPGHTIVRVTRPIPKKGRLVLKSGKGGGPLSGRPAFLVDRREQEMAAAMKALDAELQEIAGTPSTPSKVSLRLPKRAKNRRAPAEMTVTRGASRGRGAGLPGVWLAGSDEPSSRGKVPPAAWHWLPPVVWPKGEEPMREAVRRLVGKGARNFVLNAPWQLALFGESGPKGMNLWAGPFCNQANGLSIEVLGSLGFNGAIVSPELTREDYLLLPQQSSLPLGIVVAGNWPLAVARTLVDELKAGKPFASPMGEQSWVRKNGDDYWLYPGWRLDITAKREELRKAGYAMFVTLDEPVPKEVRLKQRPGLWNWDLKLL